MNRLFFSFAGSVSSPTVTGNWKDNPARVRMRCLFTRRSMGVGVWCALNQLDIRCIYALCYRILFERAVQTDSSSNWAKRCRRRGGRITFSPPPLGAESLAQRGVSVEGEGEVKKYAHSQYIIPNQRVSQRYPIAIIQIIRWRKDQNYVRPIAVSLPWEVQYWILQTCWRIPSSIIVSC